MILGGTNEFCTNFSDTTILQLCVVDFAADSIASFEDPHRLACSQEISCRGEASKTSAYNDDIDRLWDGCC
ncbi:hypothetical protein HBH51_097540 [Parastagonospora nodorum]|nr:hypothetical protein HBH51_097540 [Parastagonospora nodorum]